MKGKKKMDYAILDELEEQSNERLQRYLEVNPGIYVKSKIFEADEPFEGSDPNVRVFIFSNYMSKTGLINLAIVIREVEREGIKKEGSEDALQVRSDVETSIFPIYLSKTTEAGIYDMPEKIECPEITPARAKFIIEHRERPKKPRSEQFNADIHRWTVNMIAQALEMSNRIVAQYIKANDL